LTRLRERPRRIFRHGTALAALPLVLTLAGGARAESLATVGTVGAENLRLPGGERVGLSGGTLLFDAGDDWWVGPAVYGAVSGHRGGFFVGGVEVQRRWRAGPGLSLATGLYAGGGGGAAAPVGGGLMLRPAVTLWKDIGSSFQLGLSWSAVRFPSGQIDSRQLGVTMAWRSEFLHLSHGGESGTWPLQSTGLGFDRMAMTLASDRFDDGSGRRIRLVGARAERRAGPSGLSWGLDAAAAAQGGGAGYMEILGTAAFTIEPAPSTIPGWRVGVRGGVGAGGGGSVPTGGGLIVKLAGTMEWRLAPGWTLGGEYGDARSANGPWRARQAQVWVGMSLEPGLDGRGPSDGSTARSEWVAAWQHHMGRARTDGTSRPLDTIGLKLNRSLGDHVYLSGQAHSAFAGGAGAYSIGLVGIGLTAEPKARLRVGAEVLVGAAGGGGVQSGGGAIVQGLAWAAWAATAHSEWRAGLGALRSVRGGTASPVIELAWSRSFSLTAR
jgi:hypothetical protein